jgi:hypothetical protein
MGAGLMSLTAVKALLKKMTDSHGQAFSHPDSKAKMYASSLNRFFLKRFALLLVFFLASLQPQVYL